MDKEELIAEIIRMLRDADLRKLKLIYAYAKALIYG